jgi:hypothetical protein
MTVEPRPDNDDEATAQTIARMRQYVREDSQAPAVQRAAIEAAGGASTPRRQAEGVFRWVRSRIRFIEDAELVRGISPTAAEDEVLIRPVDLLAMAEPQGDCDDFAMLTAAMLRALGIPASFRTIAADRSAPASYSHVYTIAHLPDGPLALDTSHGPRPGWQAGALGKERTWPVDMTVRTLAAIDWNQIIQSGIQAGTQIATARWGQPPAGTYISTPQGTIYRQQEGAAALQFPNPTASSSWIWIAGGLVALFLFASVAKGQGH